MRKRILVPMAGTSFAEAVLPRLQMPTRLLIARCNGVEIEDRKAPFDLRNLVTASQLATADAAKSI